MMILRVRSKTRELQNELRGFLCFSFLVLISAVQAWMDVNKMSIKF